MRSLLLLVLVWFAIELARELIPSREGPSRVQVQAVLRSWPETSRHAALGLIARLGTPQGVRRDALWWDERGESRIVVYRTPRRDSRPADALR